MYTIIKLTVLLALKCATLSRALQVSRINYVLTISFDRVLSLSSYSDIIALVLLYKTKMPLYIEITTKTAHSSCSTTIQIFMALKYKRINWKKLFWTEDWQIPSVERVEIFKISQNITPTTFLWISMWMLMKMLGCVFTIKIDRVFG